MSCKANTYSCESAASVANKIYSRFVHFTIVYIENVCLHSKYIFVNYDKLQRSGRVAPPSSTTIGDKRKLSKIKLKKTFAGAKHGTFVRYICTVGQQHPSIFSCTELLNYILNEVNRCLVIIIFSIIRLHVSEINGLNSINSVNGDFMIQYIEIVSPGCRIVRPSSLTQESQKPPARVPSADPLSASGWRQSFSCISVRVCVSTRCPAAGLLVIFIPI